jgi:sugar phosphate isomerase/epimerase
MHIGYLSNCLRPATLAQAIQQAKENGFAHLEVGPSVALDRVAFANAVRDGKVTIDALIYCRNVLDGEPARRAEFRQGLEARLDLAGELKIPAVTTFTGRFAGATQEENDAAFVQYFGPLVEKAGSLGVRLAFENCHSEGNMASSPEQWRHLFGLLPSPVLGLCYDPSHAMRQLIDAYEPLAEFASRIVYVHAKDTELVRSRMNEVGMHGRGWWRFRLPGLGDLNWVRWLSGLRDIGFDGFVSIEHEDQQWVGSQQIVAAGLRFSRTYLEACLAEVSRT